MRKKSVLAAAAAAALALCATQGCKAQEADNNAQASSGQFFEVPVQWEMAGAFIGVPFLLVAAIAGGGTFLERMERRRKNRFPDRAP